jgi:hypothetical protein
MNKTIVFAIVLLLVGCGSSVLSSEPTVGPNGHTAFVIRCLHLDKMECMQEAGKTCSGGYSVERTSSNGHVILVECKQ